MSAADGLILLLALVAVGGAVVYRLRRRHGCGECSDCPHSRTCHRNPPGTE